MVQPGPQLMTCLTPRFLQVPIAGALFVATCLGTPVIALTGLKMGMFAAVGGGIMGFATGKMFAEHEYDEYGYQYYHH